MMVPGASRYTGPDRWALRSREVGVTAAPLGGRLGGRASRRQGLSMYPGFSAKKTTTATTATTSAEREPLSA